MLWLKVFLSAIFREHGVHMIQLKDVVEFKQIKVRENNEATFGFWKAECSYQIKVWLEKSEI